MGQVLSSKKDNIYEIVLNSLQFVTSQMITYLLFLYVKGTVATVRFINCIP